MSRLRPRKRRHGRNQLWLYRRRLGFTQKQVAAMVGYHSAADICHYERGAKLPSLVTALKLEAIYRTPVAFLFYDLFARLRREVQAKEAEVCRRPPLP